MTKEISIPDDYDIYWEKWVDPYENIMHTSIQSAYSEEDDEEKEEYEEEALHIGIKSVLTPFG
ncbi:MAG: hypothetical protein GTO02_12200, partial [Candidatus Dadabacteria bacterium]|nr:hypothetical protein [Candidatus Dadabacteria bacterium]